MISGPFSKYITVAAPTDSRTQTIQLEVVLNTTQVDTTITDGLMSGEITISSRDRQDRIVIPWMCVYNK